MKIQQQQQSMQMRRGECRAWRVALSRCLRLLSILCRSAKTCVTHLWLLMTHSMHEQWACCVRRRASSRLSERESARSSLPLFYYVYKNSASPRERFMRPALHAAVRLMPREIAFLCLLQAHPRRCLRLQPPVHKGVMRPQELCGLVGNQKSPGTLKHFWTKMSHQVVVEF